MGVVQVPIYKLIKVAFLIGNGFDLGLGLKTSYRDFIKFYLSEEISTDLSEEEKECIKRFKEKIILDLPNWSNAEFEFGKLPFSELSSNLNVEEVYSLCADDFQYSLCQYLLEQERLVNKDLAWSTYTTVFRDALWNVIKSAPTIEAVLSIAERKVNINVDFINFNYTSTFDNLLGLQRDKKIYGVEGGGENVACVVGRVCHVHGSLERCEDILFGVNEREQIKDKQLFDMSDAYGYGIKPMMAKHVGDNFYNLSKAIVDEAHVIILFGLSYGATDRVWWDVILDRVFGQDVSLIVCPFKSNPRRLISIPQKMQAKKQEAIKLLKHTRYGTEDEIVSRLIDRVNFRDLYGPHSDPENGEPYYCDPLHLNYFKRHCVQSSD